MMYETLCQCEEGLGVPHWHTPKRLVVRLDDDVVMNLSEGDYKLNTDRITEVLSEIPKTIKVPIDWKALAKAVMTE